MLHGIENINQYINLYDIKRFMESMSENQVVKYSIGIISLILCIGIINYHYSNHDEDIKSRKRKRVKDRTRNVNNNESKQTL